MENKESPLKSAICDFKKKVQKITKDNNNPFYKSKYADLATILDVIDEDLAGVGLVLTSKTDYHETNLVVITELLHKNSNESMVSIFPVFGTKPQEIGSSITYGRRYNIQSLLNLAAVDDDGNEANNAKPIKKDIIVAYDGDVQKAGFKNAAEAKKTYIEKLSKLKAIDTIDKWNKAEKSVNEFIEQLAIYDSQSSISFQEEVEKRKKEIGVVDFIDDDVPDFIK